MQWTLIVGLAVVIVIGAWALGTYMRRMQELPPSPRPAARRPAAAPSGPATGSTREVRVVVAWLLSQAFEQTGIKVADDRLAYERIAEAAERAVEQLRSEPVVEISLPYLTADASGPKHFEARLTREMIDELAKY